MTEQPDRPFERILVALDETRESLEALDHVAWLAAGLGGRLQGLFIEDTDLFRLAGFPFAREIFMSGTGGRALDPAAIERDLKAAATHAQRAIEDAARRLGLEWRFDVIRRRAEQAIAEASTVADLVVVGRTSGALARHGRRGSLFGLARSTAASVLLCGTARTRRHGPIMVHGGAPEAVGRVQRIAARIAKATGEKLFELPAPRDVLAACGLASPARPLAEQPGLIVLGLDGLSEEDPLAAALENARCALLAIRFGKA
jgi:hypothetical protein